MSDEPDMGCDRDEITFKDVKLAEPHFVEVVNGHEEIRQEVAKKHGPWSR